MEFLSAIPSNWKNMIKQNDNINKFRTTQHCFIQNARVLTVQKVTLKELYWILITITDHQPTSQKYSEKKINELSLEWKEIYRTPPIVSRNTYEVFSVQSFKQCTFYK